MSKGNYLIIVIAIGLGIGVAFAQESGTPKTKQKEKVSKEKIDEKAKAAVDEEMQRAYAFTLTTSQGGYLGVYLEEVTPDSVKELGLKEERGALVMKVVEGSPAEKAGLKENDVIVALNGKRVDSVGELQRIMGETPAGRTVSIDVVRGGAQQTLSATLAKRSEEVLFKRRAGELDPAKKEIEKALQGVEKDRERLFELEKKRGELNREFGNFNFVFPGMRGMQRGRLGLVAEPLTGQLAEYFGVKSGAGVLVTEVVENRPAAKAGLKAGDVIVAADDEKVDSVNALASAVARKDEGTITLKIVRNRAEQTVTVTLEKRAPRAPARRSSRRVAQLLAVA
ncbi:MAG TPA: PDZ domain-containing protein [Blastocatellia bacterium]|nr:PDZ domain-containing protein [Blastocatellia bacterium]